MEVHDGRGGEVGGQRGLLSPEVDAGLEDGGGRGMGEGALELDVVVGDGVAVEEVW